MNPLLSDRFVDFLLYDVLDATALCKLPAFAHHGRETFDPYLAASRRVAREVLYPAYRALDEKPPRLENGAVRVHPKMQALWKELVDLGLIVATRPPTVGGQQLPLTVAALASAYLMAGNLSATAYVGLTNGAAHLLEAFGSDELKERLLKPMHEGRWAGTMALTEPQAGSSLADLTTRARPAPGGHHLITGSKIFISGGDQDITENIVHMVLARLEGAPAGTKGISLFAVPKRRLGAKGALVPNDVQVSGVIHKIGWRGLPSLALSFGEEGDCHGWLVGTANTGLKQMFQMMNEARLMVGLNAAATAAVAYQESLAYARERRQGRPLGVADASMPPVPLTAHPDVRRMLLRQKAIVEGALCLAAVTARYADLAEHAPFAEVKARSKLLLDLLTPITKTFPSEKGFESNALALQIHGGYGYSSEYLPEAWMRDQKLNSIHEGTTSIQGLDLLGRKVVAGGGAALLALAEEVGQDAERAQAAGLSVAPLRAAVDQLTALTASLGARGMSGDLVGMLGHSADFMELASITVIGWMWCKLAASAGPDDFGKGIKAAARYWLATEVPRVPHLASLCESAEPSYLELDEGWL
jgi:butyryl-CoA dehydrogenase